MSMCEKAAPFGAAKERLDVAGAKLSCPWLHSAELRHSCDETFETPAIDLSIGINYVELMVLKLELCFPAGLERPPTIRARQIFYHSHVDEMGYFSDAFYDLLAWPGSPRTLTHVVTVLKAFLEYTPVLPEMSHVSLINAWHKHDPGCDCMFGRCLPYDFPVLQSLPQWKQREELNRISMTLAAKRLSSEKSAQARRNATLRYAQQARSPALFGNTWCEDWLAPEFMAALRVAKSSGAAKDVFSKLADVVHEVIDGVFSFPMFTSEFCDMLVSELKAYDGSGLSKPRPNSMNNYGLVLNDIGMEQMFDSLLADVIKPLASVLLSRWGASTLDHHHTFLVEYRDGQDLSLDMHEDDSDVTLNVNLLDGFEGSGLCFCGYVENADHRKHALTYAHRRGFGVLHAGCKRHGALPLTRGERVNLIVWCRSSTYRRTKQYELDRRSHSSPLRPDRICLSRTHDDDYSAYAHGSPESAQKRQKLQE